jgi:dynein regulatory complex protein 1
METEIQNLEKCYEDMKALYQLNTEKLDYNLKVLKEKQISHTHTHDDLKRRDQNLNNRLRSLIKDYNEFDTKFK